METMNCSDFYKGAGAALNDRGDAGREKRMEISNNQSSYVNPNTRYVTSNEKNTAIKDQCH